MTPQEQLCEKMRQEQNKYYDWLTAQPPEEILRHAYEYSVREDIILATEEMNLTPAQVRELLKSPAPLADVYKDFSKLETDYMSIVAQCVEDRADDLLKKEQQQNPPKVYPTIHYLCPASITRYSSTGNLIALTSVAAMKSTAQSRCTTMVCAWVTVLLSRWWRNTVWSAPNMCWQRPFKSATAMGAFPAQTKNGQILCALSRTWTSVGLTGLAIMQVCKRTPVCWMALRIKCENLKRPKPNPPTVHPKDNRSVCILQALFFVKKSLFCERISL